MLWYISLSWGVLLVGKSCSQSLSPTACIPSLFLSFVYPTLLTSVIPYNPWYVSMNGACIPHGISYLSYTHVWHNYTSICLLCFNYILFKWLGVLGLTFARIIIQHTLDSIPFETYFSLHYAIVCVLIYYLIVLFQRTLCIDLLHTHLSEHTQTVSYLIHSLVTIKL